MIRSKTNTSLKFKTLLSFNPIMSGNFFFQQAILFVRQASG